MISQTQVDKCYEILQSDHSTNFEVRMVAEINLYWVIYQNCSGSAVDLVKTQDALHVWKQHWKFVLGMFAHPLLDL